LTYPPDPVDLGISDNLQCVRSACKKVRHAFSGSGGPPQSKTQSGWFRRPEVMLLKGSIMAQPLTMTYPDGKPYRRPAEIEITIDAALAQDLKTQYDRALIRDFASPDYLPSECLLHLIRDAQRRNDERAFNGLLPRLLARCEANLNARVDSKLRQAPQLRKDILGDFAELIATDGPQLDFFEIRFNKAFVTFRETRVRKERTYQRSQTTMPEIPDEIESVEQELESEIVARLGDLQSDDGNPEDRLYRKQLLAAIKNLPPDQLDAFVLVYLNGLTQAEAAKQCGVTERTIFNRLTRALKTLDRLKEDV
jgi:RNA polymerase sigma factor (sigma-70 family)